MADFSKESSDPMAEPAGQRAETNQMKITVKSAHFVRKTYISQSRLCEHLKLHLSHEDNPHLKQAFDALNQNRKEDEVDWESYPSIDPQCGEEIRTLQLCLMLGRVYQKVRSSANLMVEPSLTVGALKSLLKTVSWIPKENLVLCQPKSWEASLEDDSATLDECGVKEDDSLMACMGGSFLVTVCNGEDGGYYSIPISSCFETIGEVKKKIHQYIGRQPNRQQLTRQNYQFGSKGDDVPLVSCGIVKPYLINMLGCSDWISLSYPGYHPIFSYPFSLCKD